MNEVSGEHNDAIIRLRERPRLLKVVDMSVVQRIVLRYDADNPHDKFSAETLNNPYIKYTIFGMGVVYSSGWI